MSETPNPSPTAAGRVFDLKTFGEEILGTVSEALDGLIESSVDDLVGKDAFLIEIGQYVATSAATGDDVMYAEAMSNMPWIAERHRVRAVNAQWTTINKVLNIVRASASAAIKSFIPVGGVSDLIGLSLGKDD